MATTTLRAASRPFSAVLAADSTLRVWMARATRHAQIDAVLREELPAGVARLTRVLDAATERLVLGAANGASTLALRRAAPALLGRLGKAGFVFVDLRVVVVPRFTPRPPRRFARRRIDRRGAAALAALAEGLPQGPLRAAVERLASHHEHQALQEVEHQDRPQDQQREPDDLADE